VFFVETWKIEQNLFHAGLSNEERTSMIERISDPQSSLLVLIIMYQVSAQGVNLDSRRGFLPKVRSKTELSRGKTRRGALDAYLMITKPKHVVTSHRENITPICSHDNIQSKNSFRLSSASTEREAKCDTKRG
jgi:hypothetical protein